MFSQALCWLIFNKLEYVRALSLYLSGLCNYPCSGGVTFKAQWS